MGFLRSFVYAGRGIWFCIRHERNFRIHMVAAAYVLIFAPYFSLTRGDVYKRQASRISIPFFSPA